jgi:hypothetical protein
VTEHERDSHSRREKEERAVAARTPEPHGPLSQPARDPDPTEWPDPFDKRPDPRVPAEDSEELRPAGPGATSTSEPHPRADPEAEPVEGPKREKLDR